MIELTMKIVMLEENDFHCLSNRQWATVAAYEAIKRTLGVGALPNVLKTDGIMNNIWIKGRKGLRFWSNNISNYVHETDPNGGPGQEFKFVIGDDGKLIKSPFARE